MFIELLDILHADEFDANEPPEILKSTSWEWEGQRAILAVLPEPYKRRLAIRFERDDGSWTVATRQILYTRPPRSWTTTPADLRALAEEALVKERRFRTFPHLNGLRIASNSLGVWDTEKVSNPPRFGLGRRVSNLSWSQTRDLVERLLARPDSDICFARQFHEANALERRAQLFGIDDFTIFGEAQNEVNRLVRYLLQSEFDVWHEEQRVSWRLGSGANFVAWLNARGQYLRVEPPNARLKMWARLLREFGPLRPRLDSLCLRYAWQSYTFAQVEVEAPTSHEQLEARLELRAWAKSHLPPDVQMELERLES